MAYVADQSQNVHVNAYFQLYSMGQIMPVGKAVLEALESKEVIPRSTDGGRHVG